MRPSVASAASIFPQLKIASRRHSPVMANLRPPNGDAKSRSCRPHLRLHSVEMRSRNAMALMMVTRGIAPAGVMDPLREISFPASVVEMLRGDLGQPPGGWPPELQRKVLKGEKPSTAHHREPDPRLAGPTRRRHRSERRVRRNSDITTGMAMRCACKP